MYRVYQKIAVRLEDLGTSFVGDPPDAVQVPYMFVWGRFPSTLEGMLSSSVGFVDTSLHVTCVAGSPANALRLASQVETLLAGWAPTVTGWHVEPLSVWGSHPVQSSQQHTDAATNRIPEAVVLEVRVRAVKDGE